VVRVLEALQRELDASPREAGATSR